VLAGIFECLGLWEGGLGCTFGALYLLDWAVYLSVVGKPNRTLFQKLRIAFSVAITGQASKSRSVAITVPSDLPRQNFTH
jgi:hypothetical protein